jgi:hypothetical protein
VRQHAELEQEGAALRVGFEQSRRTIGNCVREAAVAGKNQKDAAFELQQVRARPCGSAPPRPPPLTMSWDVGTRHYGPI